MERARFEELVAAALDSLPEILRERIDNVTVEVHRLADREMLHRVKTRNPMNLLGLYQGIPYNRRGPWYGNVMPDRILIFQQPIEARCRTPEEVRQMVRSVLVHEIGHYYGLGEAELRRLEQTASQPDRPGPGTEKRDG